MASLRLKFPEKADPSVIVLSGPRVTLGRLPLNTIQIVDRTLSGFHAEFVLEEDHYRLHDRGSTNGTFVNGESVTDFHLREACKVAFGALECEFSPETPAAAEDANVEALPTRSEINAVRQENAEFKQRVESLREELGALNKTRTTETGAGTVAVAQEEYDKLVAEREALKESQHTLQKEVEKLKTDLALLQLDRENLKQVASNAQAEFARFRAELAAEAPKPVAKEPEPATVESMLLPPPPVASAPVPLPKPSFQLSSASRVAPKPPDSLPTKQPAPSGSGLRPVPIARPAATGAPKPPVRLPTASAPAPKGSTQRLELESTLPSKPIAPTGKPAMKPPMKLPLQPTVKMQASVAPPRSPAPTKPGGNGPDHPNSEES